MSDFTDYSRFDNVASPVAVTSAQLQVVYANAFAIRQYPFFASSEGLTSRLSEDKINSVRRSAEAGQACTVPFDTDMCVSLLFEPSFGRNGQLHHICVYVVFDCLESAPEFSVFSDSELLRSLQRGIGNPINRILQQMQVLEGRKGTCDREMFLCLFDSIRCKLLRMSLFTARLSDCPAGSEQSFVLADADRALIACESAFSAMKYKSGGTCYVPMARDSLLLLFTDVLAGLHFRQTKPGIAVSSASSEDGIVLKFASGPLAIPLDQPCEHDYDGIESGMLSVRRRMERTGGELTVRSRAHNAVTVILKFPKLDRYLSGGTVEDVSYGQKSFTEVFVLEYLKTISDKDA